MRVKLDATICDAFGACAAHAPGVFSLDEWGYANLLTTDELPEAHEAGARRAIADCPVHALSEWHTDSN